MINDFRQSVIEKKIIFRISEEVLLPLLCDSLTNFTVKSLLLSNTELLSCCVCVCVYSLIIINRPPSDGEVKAVRL